MTTSDTASRADATGRVQAIHDERRSRWPLLGAAAGLLGLAATIPLDGRQAFMELSAAKALAGLDPLVYQLSMVVGYLAVVMLLVTAASWRRRVEPRTPRSTAASLVPLALVASAAGLTYGYAWKGALGHYLPGSTEPNAFDAEGLYVYYMLNDFGSFIGWFGVVVAAGAVTWMGLREHTVSRWIGVISLFPVLGVLVMAGVLGIPGVPGLFGPVWLVVAFTGLAFGRSTIAR